MDFIWNGFRGALTLLEHPDADFRSIVMVTLQVSIGAAIIALALGVPAGIALGLGRFRGRTLLTTTANAGFGLPPVVVGLVLALLFFRRGPLGSFDLIYTVRGMIVAQLVLDLPIVVALTVVAVQAIDPSLLAQARALGAGRVQLGVFAMREARAGIVVAALAALGAGFSEVAAVVLVGGNIDEQTRTAGGAILTSISAGRYSQGIALGVVLLGAIFVLAAAMTLIQQRTRDDRNSRVHL
jgi:tungstate transport system permease protein